MKILTIHPSSDLYGADRIFVKTISFLEEVGYTIDVVLKGHGPIVKLINDNTNANIIIKKSLPVAIRSNFGFKSTIIFFINNITFYLFLFANRKKYNLVYVNTLALFTIPLLAKLSFIKKAFIHSHEIIGKHGLVSKVIIFLSQYFSNRVICVSNAVKKDMLDNSLKKHNDKFSIVHNGIEDISLNVKIESSQQTRFVLIARIMPEKGQWFLLDTLKLIKKHSLEKIRIDIVGSPPPFRENLLEELKNKVNEYDLQNVVYISNFIEDPAEIICNADVVLVPSIMADPFPTTVLEGMCCRKPIISTNHGGSKEIIKVGETGFLIAPYDTAAFKDSILYFLNKPHKIKIFGENSRNLYEEYLTLESFKTRFLKVFNG